MRIVGYKPVVVVIPVYNSRLSHYEQVSLDSCLTILGKHPITIIAPQGLSLDNINLNGVEVHIEFLDPSFFVSIVSYNKLLLSPDFYQIFIRYKYILICQLDALVFKDDLLFWCNQKFDYVGAPWFEHVKYYSQNLTALRRLLTKLKIPIKKTRVGNGGFSLRNIRKTILVLLLFKPWASKWAEHGMPEDLFFAYFVTSYFPFYKIASSKISIKFAFEFSPERCYRINHGNLPFGCHAWDRPENIIFWQSLLNSLKSPLPNTSRLL